MPRWLSAQEQHAWRGLLQMTGRLDTEINRHLQDLSGLSQADYGILVALSETPAERLRPFELGRELNWEQSRLSHHLSRMVKRDLVERENCSEDRRGAFVVLTAAGRQAIENAAPAHVAAVRRLVFDALSEQEVRTLAAVSDKVLARLDDQAEEHGPTATH
jgi:DNA-binding MarR family transcriptional regulator